MLSRPTAMDRYKSGTSKTSSPPIDIVETILKLEYQVSPRNAVSNVIMPKMRGNACRRKEEMRGVWLQRNLVIRGENGRRKRWPLPGNRQ
jgi:hypothetical protein